jgi:hypothetical protein
LSQRELPQLFERINNLEIGGGTYESKNASCINVTADRVGAIVYPSSGIAFRRSGCADVQ